VPISLIDPNPNQARQAFDPVALEELAASIRAYGVLEPILLCHWGDRYRIVAGERRYRAALSAGLPSLPALILDDIADTDLAMITAIENLQRANLDIEDEARQFSYLLSLTNLSQRELAELLGVGYNYLSRRVRLLERPDLLAAVRGRTLPLNAALAQLSDDREPARELIERDTLDGSVSPGHMPPRASSPSVSPGHTSTAQPPRWRYVEEAYRHVRRIEPREIPSTERAEWVSQLRALAEFVSEKAKAIEEQV